MNKFDIGDKVIIKSNGIKSEISVVFPFSSGVKYYVYYYPYDPKIKNSFDSSELEHIIKFRDEKFKQLLNEQI